MDDSDRYSRGVMSKLESCEMIAVDEYATVGDFVALAETSHPIPPRPPRPPRPPPQLLPPVAPRTLEIFGAQLSIASLLQRV